MRIEAIGLPLKYKWPAGEVYLQPGRPIELPNDRALKLLKRVAPGRVRASVTWFRYGVEQIGLVDFVHCDSSGCMWAFVSDGENWSAVNLRYVEKAKQS
jgi:hypothetical protein